jgi:arylsulfatase A-like enzyme
MDYVAMQSCTSGRDAFFTGMYPLRTGMIPPQLPGSPSYLRPGTPALAKFLIDLGYTTLGSTPSVPAVATDLFFVAPSGQVAHPYRRPIQVPHHSRQAAARACAPATLEHL